MPDRLTHHQMNVNTLVVKQYGVSARDWVRLRRSSEDYPSWRQLAGELASASIFVSADQLRRWYGRSGGR